MESGVLIADSSKETYEFMVYYVIKRLLPKHRGFTSVPLTIPWETVFI